MGDWSDVSILITGGTGTFGQECVRTLLNDYRPRRVIVFSRDELKQHQMRLNGFDDSNLRYFIGDVRDLERLRRAMRGVDLVIHAAAMKHVPVCEYNPVEAVLTNVTGTRNVVEAALDTGVQKVMFISTDKAVNPINLYGATKLVGEKLIVQANAYSGGGFPRFSSVRYGNVVGSSGSVVPLFLSQRKQGVVTVTDPRMDRFWIKLSDGVRFVLQCLDEMLGGEVFIPKLSSMNIMDLVKAVAPECDIEYVGMRLGEKLHEVLISEDEAAYTWELENKYVLSPAYSWSPPRDWSNARPLPEGYRYASDTNPQRLTADELKSILGPELGVD